MGPAAVWVTVILFMEIARRALRPMRKQHLVVLLHASGVMIYSFAWVPGGPFGWLVYRAYLVTSEVARDAHLHADTRAQGAMLAAWAPALTAAPEVPVDIVQSLFYALDPFLVPRKFVAFASVDPASDKAAAFVAQLLSNGK